MCLQDVIVESMIRVSQLHVRPLGPTNDADDV